MQRSGRTAWTGAGALGTAAGAAAAYNANNHRSWHPVFDNTGRTLSERRDGTASIANNWTKPWSNGVGSQTMYCSDCHGSGTVVTGTKSGGTAATNSSGSVFPTGNNSTTFDGDAWGPARIDEPLHIEEALGPVHGHERKLGRRRVRSFRREDLDARGLVLQVPRLRHIRRKWRGKDGLL